MKRLEQAEVLAVLKCGKRLIRSGFELRFLSVPAGAAIGESKIAISVPKRLLKSSVARNRIKRLVREEFRVHRIVGVPLHMLVNYQAKNDGRNAVVRRDLRRALGKLFEDAILRTKVAHADNTNVCAG